MANSYSNSKEFLEKSLKYIPLASQTFSKSIIQLPENGSPFFFQKGKGCKVWDLDNNEFTDYVSGLLSISLGYQDPDVNEAVLSQLTSQGVNFSLPHPLETKLAEKIVNLIPSAEKVRFGKNGTDATSAAIRLSRAYTKRDMVAVCGYHGWQDWYIGSTTRKLGIPKSTQDLTKTFRYNDIDSLNELFLNHKDQFAAVILEPMNIEYPKDGFLDKVKELSHKHGAIFILDETITGFRFSLGGAQQLFNITPDLSCFGKGMANGFPLSVITGKPEIMSLMEEIFFSSTFGGETLSLAASLATIEKMEKQNVPDHLSNLGTYLLKQIDEVIAELDAQDLIKTAGHPAWSFLIFNPPENVNPNAIKTLFMQEMFKRNIFIQATHNLNFAHKQKDVDHLVNCYKEVFSIIYEGIKNNRLETLLEGKPIEPVFKVR